MLVKEVRQRLEMPFAFLLELVKRQPAFPGSFLQRERYMGVNELVVTDEEPFDSLRSQIVYQHLMAVFAGLEPAP